MLLCFLSLLSAVDYSFQLPEVQTKQHPFVRPVAVDLQQFFRCFVQLSLCYWQSNPFPISSHYSTKSVCFVFPLPAENLSLPWFVVLYNWAENRFNFPGFCFCLRFVCNLLHPFFPFPNVTRSPKVSTSFYLCLFSSI